MRWYCHCPTAHTALLKSHYRGDNAHSFACVRLFLRVVCFILDQTIVASDKCLSYARILLFPTGTQYPVGTHYTVSRGDPDNCTFVITLSQAIMLTLLLVCAFFSTQVQKYLAWVYNKVSLPGDASYASLLTNRLSQATVGCLMLAYSFSPRVHSIPRGPRIFARKDIKCVARDRIKKERKFCK